MIFYQQTLDSVDLQLLIDSIHEGSIISGIPKMSFCDFPEIQELEEALQIIENKRKTLQHPLQHNYLCIEMDCKTEMSPTEQFELASYLANSINEHFGNDLFIISYLYQDQLQISHPLIIISDIERSLHDASSYFLDNEELHQIISRCLPDYEVSEILYKKIYIINGESSPLSYDGVFHVSCLIKNKELYSISDNSRS